MREPGNSEGRGIWRSRAATAFVIVVGWSLLALAWTPPTVLVNQQMHSGPVNWTSVFLSVLLGFVAWMLATPFLLQLSRRFPVAEGHALRSIAVLAALGIVIIPLVIFAGYIIASVIPGFKINPQAFSTQTLLNPTIITALYSIPTYVAVIGIGQAMAYIERYRTRERLLARAELRALESQLNPHFLFNTLNSISALGYRDPALADRALTQLSAMLRTTLKERPQLVPLKDEIAFLKDYLELYTLLIAGPLDQVFATGPDVWNAAVPAMILQPLAENALVHGIAKLGGGGQLMLTAAHDGDRLKISLLNPVPDNSAPSPGAGIGLANVRERLRVLFGDDAHLTFERGPKEASVLIDLPFRDMGA